MLKAQQKREKKESKEVRVKMERARHEKREEERVRHTKREEERVRKSERERRMQAQQQRMRRSTQCHEKEWQSLRIFLCVRGL